MRFTAQLVGAFAVAAAAVPHVPRAILAYRSVRPPLEEIHTFMVHPIVRMSLGLIPMR